MNHNVNIDLGLHRGLAKASGLCCALALIPLLHPKFKDGAFFFGPIFGFIFGYALALAHKGLGLLIILASALCCTHFLGLWR